MNLFKFTFIIFMTIGVEHAVFAQSNGWAFNAGAFQHNMISLTKDKDAKADFFGDTYLPIGFQYSFSVGTSWRFVPGLNFTHATTLLIPKETPEEGAKKNLFFLNLPMVTNIASWADGKLGLGYFSYEIKGEGGTVDLPNGTGTSTFYQPSETRTSQNLYFLLGLSWPMSGWNLDLDILINGAGSEERRSYNLFLYASYPFGSSY